VYICGIKGCLQLVGYSLFRIVHLVA
jgi:hypothetical protein